MKFKLGIATLAALIAATAAQAGNPASWNGCPPVVEVCIPEAYPQPPQPPCSACASVSDPVAKGRRNGR